MSLLPASSTVSTGDRGLDLLLGGGVRLIERIEGKASATIVVRGGAGTGKSILSTQISVALARHLQGDVIIACVEILPTEVLAQIRGSRPDLDAVPVVLLPVQPGDSETITQAPTRIFVGLLDDLDAAAPDLVGSTEKLLAAAVEAGARPTAIVVDSLIDGYGIGASATRAQADEVMKFAVQRGLVMVLCEEVSEASQSGWVFAADTIIELGVGNTAAVAGRERWIEIRKHRFGGSSNGQHELRLWGWRAPEAYPHSSAWRHASRTERVEGATGHSTLSWQGPSNPNPARPITADLVLIRGPDSDLVRRLADTLRPMEAVSSHDLLFRIDPLMTDYEFHTRTGTGSTHIVQPSWGPARELRMMIERFHDSRSLPLRRVIIGDVDGMVASREGPEWVLALQSFVSVVIASSSQVPVILFGSGDGVVASESSASLFALADVVVSLDASTHTATTGGIVESKWGESYRVSWHEPRKILRPHGLEQLEGSGDFIRPRR